jgi:hypothetical protein
MSAALSGRAAKEWDRRNSPRTNPPNWQTQLQQRGWTRELINEAIATGRRYLAPNYVNLGNMATWYVSPRTGQSVVVDDQTGEVSHVGAAGYKY